MPAKHAPVAKKRKLTDFFSQASSMSVPAAATTCNPATMTTAKISSTRKKPATRGSKAIIDREMATRPSAPPQTRSASTMTTRKRARSPDNDHYSAPLFPPSKLKSLRKPGKISESCACGPDAVYVSSRSPSHSSLPQFSAPIQSQDSTIMMSPSSSSKEIVYSSQSDEEELVLPDSVPRNVKTVVEGVQNWRSKTFHSCDSVVLRVNMDTMVVDPAPFSPIHDSLTASASSASPDTNDLPPLPRTPEPIDPETKTARLIAEIKAKAFAATQSSDDEQVLSLRELDDSDDEDIVDDLPLIGRGKKTCAFPVPRTDISVFSSPLSSVPSTFNDTAIGLRSRKIRGCVSPSPPRTRMSARIPKSASAIHPTLVTSSTSAGPTRSASNGKKLKAVNPVHALLREKELEIKRGASLRLAEETTARQGSWREESGGSDDGLGTMNQLRLADEEAAWKAVREYRKSSSPVGPSGLEDSAIGDRESKMLGAINKILADNNNSGGKQKAQSMDQEAPNTFLWTRSSDEDMMVDSISIPPLSGHPILTHIDESMRNGYTSLAGLIISNGALAVVPRDIMLSNISQLLAIALFASSDVSDAVCGALRDLWGSRPHQLQMPLATVLHSLARLGADPSMLQGFGMSPELAQKNYIYHETLTEAIKRFLAILKAAAFAGALSSDDVPDIVLILAIMGLDPLTLTPSELRTQLNVTMDTVCNYSTTNNLLHDIHEKLLTFGKSLAASNKALLVSFLASGTDRTRGIARRLAYCFLVPTPITPNDQVPALEPLVMLLSPEAGSGEPFDVTDETMDYEELRHYVYILSVALNDIAPYVEEEHAHIKFMSTPSTPGSPTKSKKHPASPLDYLRVALEVLQSRIVDTRAARLDRSRTKAAIQRLTMRICYDRMACIAARPSRRMPTLMAYFSPQRT